MFYEASSFNQTIGHWRLNIYSAVYMVSMFRDAISFNNGYAALTTTTSSKIMWTINFYDTPYEFALRASAFAEGNKPTFPVDPNPGGEGS
jgi:hypothetical protein